MRAQRGFTLIEVLMATAILGLVLATVYGAVARTLAAANHAKGRADVNASGRMIVLQLADELEGALPPTAGADVAFIGKHGTASAPTDSVQFNAVIRRLAGAQQLAGGRAIVAYSLDEMQDAPGLYALRRHEELMAIPGAPTGDEMAAEGDPSVEPSEEEALEAAAAEMPSIRAVHLIDRVAGLRFFYFDPASGDFVEEWDTTQLNTSGQVPGLPAAVHITVYLADENGAVHDFSTTVDLPLANIVPTPVQG
jgi:prepilin-type N-terminal cleavage/methylation domain-containing protein